MIYKLFQLTLSKDDVDMVNLYGWEHAATNSRRIEAYFTAYIKRDYQESFDMGEHIHVADIDAQDLEQVFDIGNVGPEECIVRHGPMHSVSVGDVIQAPTGAFFAVASIGFVRVVGESED